MFNALADGAVHSIHCHRSLLQRERPHAKFKSSWVVLSSGKSCIRPLMDYVIPGYLVSTKYPSIQRIANVFYLSLCPRTSQHFPRVPERARLLIELNRSIACICFTIVSGLPSHFLSMPRLSLMFTPVGQLLQGCLFVFLNSNLSHNYGLFVRKPQLALRVYFGLLRFENVAPLTFCRIKLSIYPAIWHHQRVRCLNCSLQYKMQ